MSDPLDTTGAWFGSYAYPSHIPAPPVRFIANLDEANGAIDGTITEPNTFHRGAAQQLRAIAHGVRHGDHVDFTKTYDGSDVAAHTIEYSGTLNASGTRLTGNWLLGGMVGAFEMTRSRPGLEETRDERVEEYVGGEAR